MVLIAAIAVAAGVVVARHVDGGGSQRHTGATAVVRIRTAARGPVVPPSFLGLSIEWDSVVPYTGPRRDRRGALPRVLAPLDRAQGTPLALRIGGDTGDQAWWNPSGRPRPPTVLQDVGPGVLDAIAWLARRLGGPVTLGLNLALNDPANADAMASEARRRLPPGALAALEIGNEPDLYRRGHTFRRGGHLHRRLTKDAHYDVATYAWQADGYLRTLARPAGPRLVVGGFAGPGWWPSLPRLLRGWGRRPGALAAHLYALPQCSAPTPSQDWLMSSAASRDRVAGLRPLLAIAHRYGLPLRVDELNSAACGGRPHFSDSRAAAVWLTDTLFAILRAGAAGASVHTWRGAQYAPFAVTGSRVVARPPLAGMLAFARAAPSGSRLVAVDVRGGDGLRAWATIDRSGARRLALLARNRARVTIPSGRRTGCAGVWRFPARRGGPRCTCPQNRRYLLDLPARSLAVVTFRARARAPCSSPGPTRRRSSS